MCGAIQNQKFSMIGECKMSTFTAENLRKRSQKISQKSIEAVEKMIENAADQGRYLVRVNIENDLGVDRNDAEFGITKNNIDNYFMERGFMVERGYITMTIKWDFVD